MNEDAQGLAAAAGAYGITLNGSRLDRFRAYAALLAEWNQRFNLLGPAAMSSLWSRHFLDALTIARGITSTPADRLNVLDVGSGAGLPGIALQIAFPNWTVSLLEVTAKKARFLDLAIRELGLGNANVLHGRAEALAHEAQYRESFDLCVARAVSRAAALLEITMPFVAPGGVVIFYKSLHGLSDELHTAEEARAILGAAAPAVIPIEGAVDDARCLVRYEKVSRTPQSLPRRAGLPEQRPLTADDKARIVAAVARTGAESRRVRGNRRSAR